MTPGEKVGNRLQVIFETAEPGAGVPLDDLRRVLGHLSEAVRLLALHLRKKDRPGGEESDRSAGDTGEPCPLRVTGISGGSVVLDLTVARTEDGAGSGAGRSDDPGRRAVRAILEGGADEPGTVPRTTLPPPVTDHLAAIGESRSPAVPGVRLRDPDRGLETVLRRPAATERWSGGGTPARDGTRPAPERPEPFDRDTFLARPRKPFSFDDLPTIDDLTPEEAETFRRHLRVGRRS